MRHTVRRVASTHSAALSPRGRGVPPSAPAQGCTHPVLLRVGGGVPHPVPTWLSPDGGGTPTQSQGYPHPHMAGVHPLGLDGGTPIRDWMGYPPEVTWDQPLGYPLERTWDQWMEVLWDGDRVAPPPPRCGQTHTCENNTFPIPSECVW